MRIVREDRGLSLVEVLVAMTLSTIVFGIAATAVVDMMKNTQLITARSEAVRQMYLASQQIERQVRSGNVLYPDTSSGTLKIYTQANGSQRCVRWRLDRPTGELLTRSWSSSDVNDKTSWRVVAQNVTNPSGVQPFVVQAGSPYGGRLLEVNLQIKSDVRGKQSDQVRLAISGRNTTYGYGATVCDAEPTD